MPEDEPPPLNMSSVIVISKKIDSNVRLPKPAHLDLFWKGFINGNFNVPPPSYKDFISRNLPPNDQVTCEICETGHLWLLYYWR